MSFLTTDELKNTLSLRSPRIIAWRFGQWIIPVHALGHRTRLFDLEKVKTALAKFERRAVRQ